MGGEAGDGPGPDQPRLPSRHRLGEAVDKEEVGPAVAAGAGGRRSQRRPVPRLPSRQEVELHNRTLVAPLPPDLPLGAGDPGVALADLAAECGHGEVGHRPALELQVHHLTVAHVIVAVIHAAPVRSGPQGLLQRSRVPSEGSLIKLMNLNVKYLD